MESIQQSYDELLQFFSKPPSKDGEEREQEIAKIDDFIVTNSKLYQFDDKAIKLFVMIHKNRLQSIDVTKMGNSVYLLKLLQIVRLLTRDPRVISEETKCILKYIAIFTTLLTQYAKTRYSEDTLLLNESELEISITIEALCIIKHSMKFLTSTSNTSALTPLFSQTTIYCFLYSKNNHLLLFLSDFFAVIIDELKDDETTKTHIAKRFTDPHYLGLLLNQLTFNDNKEILILVSTLLQKLIKIDKRILQTFRKIHGNELLISLLNQVTSHDIKLALLNLISKIMASSDQILFYKSLGIIPILLYLATQTKYITEYLTVLEILSLITVDDEASVYIFKKASTLFIQMLSVLHPRSKTPYLSTFEDLALFDEAAILSILELSLFRLLRFLFCIEKNRKMCKTIFPPRLLGVFIDIGNYKHDLGAYETIVAEFNKMSEKDYKTLVDNVEKYQDINKNEKTATAHFGNYDALETIGKGAFGVVYLCRLGEARYAIKEIPIKDIPNRNIEKGANPSGKDANGVGNLEEYFRELDHQNIIKYYDSFAERDNLYIVMEYVDGFTLSEFIKIQAEKNVKIAEPTIWRIVINLCSVLKYLHVEKRIVHRDLNPSNIMITHLNEIKLADFGLAKKLSHSYSLMNSLVGTLIYSCPEIVQNQPYSEKADIWAFGCIIYELMSLKPAFSSNNPLTLAKKIVDMDFERLSATNYSKKLLDFVDLCMTLDVKKRPNVLELIAFIAEEVLSYADQTKREMLKVNESLAKTLKKMPAMLNFEPGAGGSNISSETSKIKIGADTLQRIKSDPFVPMLECLVKLTNTLSKPYNPDNDEEKSRYALENFYRNFAKTPLNTEALVNLKKELFSIVNFSREEMSIFNPELSSVPLGDRVETTEEGRSRCKTYEDFHQNMQDLYTYYNSKEGPNSTTNSFMARGESEKLSPDVKPSR